MMKPRLLSLLLLASALVSSTAQADTRADARRYFNRGMEAIEQGRAREGVELLLQAYAIRPHPNVLFNVGRAYVALNEIDQAIDYFERYLASNPPDAASVGETLVELRERQQLRSLVDRGMAAIAAGRHLEGVSLLQRAYEQRPHPNLLYNIGRAYEDAGDARNAIDTYRGYLASNPADAAQVEARIKSLSEKLERGRPTPPPVADRPRRVDPSSPALDDEEQIRRVAERLAAILRNNGPAAPAPVAPVPTTTLALAEGDVALAAKETAGYEEVVVTASRREQSPLDAPNAVSIITEEDIRLSGARNIPDLLRRVPGMDVMAMTYADYNVSMRGFNRRIANKLLVLIDGRSVYHDFLGVTLWKSLPIDLIDIERIEVVRGPGSAIYGAYAYTGMVNIITKRPDVLRGSTARVSAGNGNILDAAYQYGERKGALGFRLSGGFEQADKYELEFDPARVDFSTIAEDPELSLRRVRADGTVEYHLKDAGYFFAGGGINDSVQEFYAVSVLRNQHIDGIDFNARVGYTGELFSLLAFWNGVRLDSSPEFFRTGLPNLGSHVDSDVFSIEPVFRPSFELGGEHSLVLGAEYRHKFVEWDYLDAPHREDHFAVFAQDSWALSDAFTVLASARLDKHPLIGFLGSPRLSVIFKPSEGNAIRASIGTAFRQPTLAETYLSLAAASPVAGVAVRLVGGRDELEPERIATIDVGYLNQGDFGEFEVVGYINRVENLIIRSALEPSGVNTGFDEAIGAFIGAQSFFRNEDRTYLALGSELSTRLYPVDGVDVGASYALQYIFDQDTGDRFTDSPLHKATLWGQLRTSFGLDLGLSLHFVSSMDWIEPTFDPADPSGFDTTPLPIDASVVLIARMGYRMLDDRVELSISGTNLADTGENRHLEHPFGNRVEARVVGSVTARF